MGTWFIYSLSENGVVFYIGVTDSLNRRLREHKITYGKDIEITELEKYIGSQSAANALEKFWISKYIDLGILLKNKSTNALTETGGITECKNCGADLMQLKGKKAKEFCNSTCRSNYWQKQKRKSLIPETKKATPKQVVQIKNAIAKQFKERYDVDIPETPPMPKKEDFKDSLEFAAAKSEWKLKYSNLL